METKQLPRRAVLRGAERLSQRLPRHLNAQFERLHLTDLEAHVLLHLLKEERPVAELQKGLGVAPSTLTGVIDRLEERGLVRRVVNPADRRSFLVAAREAGLKVAARVSAFADDFETRVRARARPDDLRAFLRVVQAIDEVIG
jgi:MarR family transcriptional regulator, organic hydroperoxide resistance regulator